MAVEHLAAIFARESFSVANLTEDGSLGLRASLRVVCTGVDQIENAIPAPSTNEVIDAVDTGIRREIDEAHNRSTTAQLLC